MISEGTFPVEPWCVRETALNLDLLAASESVFALSNGHLGLRGNLDEGEPHGLPGTYLNSFYEERPLPYAESGYGYPESGQTIVNVTNGKLIRLLVDDEPFDVRYGTLHSHERVLDLRAGLLTRDVDWESPARQRMHLRSRRLVSLTHRGVAAIEYVVTAVDDPMRVVVQSELVANETLPAQSGDPRVAAALERPLEPLEHQAWDDAAVLMHRTRISDLTMAAAMKHEVDGLAESNDDREQPIAVQAETEAFEDVARTTVTATLQPGESLRLVKYLAYGWSSLRSRPALRDQALAAIASAQRTGWEGLVAEQAEFLRDFWESADVVVEGDPSLQQAVRFGLFHVLQAGARAERRGIPAKGLSGPGYDGHTFWDTEAFVVPLLTYTRPEAAADALAWRASTLDVARRHARELGFAGAMFPWRTIRGQECSGYWPAGTAAVHVNGDISRAFDLYRTVTGSSDLEHRGGVAVLVETARLWHCLGHHGLDGDWHLPGVTGPDEYTAVVDDNTFTNLVATQNLQAAADAVRRCPDLARELGVTEEETAAWLHAAEHVHLPYDEELRVPAQDEGFTRLPEWDFEAYRDRYPLLLHAPYFALYRSQVVKQADLELAIYWYPDRFDPADVARAVDYYERRTVRDSSLSACIQSVVAAEAGHLDLAYDYAREAAFIDLRDLHHNSGDGLHMASLAGAWIALVSGFGGMRPRPDELCFAPSLPAALDALTFTVRWRGARVRVRVTHDDVVLERLDGNSGGADGDGGDGGRSDDGGEGTRADGGRSEDAGEGGVVAVRLGGERLELEVGKPVRRRVSRRKPLLPRPPQPPGRAPLSTRLPS
ncbi:MAG: glycoside hydrolase family 65 protein [Actinomycetales bacterium]